jgi:hypothetical protein
VTASPTFRPFAIFSPVDVIRYTNKVHFKKK